MRRWHGCWCPASARLARPGVARGARATGHRSVDLRRTGKGGAAMRVALVIPTMGGGGAERVMATLANAWVADGAAVTLITLARSHGDKYPLHAAVQRVGLDVAAPSPHALVALRSNVLRLRALRHALRAARPDVIVSFT